MRLYIDSCEMAIKPNSYKYKTIESTTIYSEEGIFVYSENHLIRQKIIDKPVQEFIYNGIKFLCDKSEITRDDEWYQLSKNHKAISVVKEFYHLRPNALVDLVVESVDSQISDIYLETKESFHMVQQDIDSLLSLLTIENI